MKDELITHYSELMDKYRELAVLSSAESILHWDMLTKMPPGGVALRSQQLALLSGIAHRMATSPEIGRLLGSIEQHPDYDKLDSLQRRNIHLIRKGYDEQTALPESLVTEMQRQSAIATDVWKKAKARNDWGMFRPELEKNIELAKRAAGLLMKVKKTETPYDALLDIYEPRMTARLISGLFDEMREGLGRLIERMQKAPRQPDMSILQRRVPQDVQARIALSLAELVKYDVTSASAGGRIDETEHPFTAGYYGDVRITTHYYEDSVATSLFSILHESGHALYEQGLNPEWVYQPVGTAASMGFHESQSRTVENIVGRSREFWTYFLPELERLTGDRLSDSDLDGFVHAINRVRPSRIRTEADEVTYGLHVMIRFNIERDVFAERVKVREMPELWKQGYREYLGVEVENDSEGVLQDVHWAGGQYGYFPCYALGNIYSGQLLARMERDVPQWRKELEKGNFTPAREWMLRNVHSQGSLYDPPVLIKRVTGQDITVKLYLDYLNDKYSKLYGF